MCPRHFEISRDVLLISSNAMTKLKLGPQVSDRISWSAAHIKIQLQLNSVSFVVTLVCRCHVYCLLHQIPVHIVAIMHSAI